MIIICYIALRWAKRLLARDAAGPVAQQGGDDGQGQGRVFHHVLRHAIGELLVEVREELQLVERHQGLQGGDSSRFQLNFRSISCQFHVNFNEFQ